MFFHYLSTLALVLIVAICLYKWIVKPMFSPEISDKEKFEELKLKIKELERKKEELKLLKDEIDITVQLNDLNKKLDEKYEQLGKLEGKDD